MHISDAQRDMRSAFMGGFVAQLIIGVIWAAAAAVSAWISEAAGMATLFFGSALLFPLTQGVLRLMGRPATLRPGNSLGGLAMQIAFTVPIGFLLVGAATLYERNWFFPAAMIVVGAHYMPFIFLYGMWQFGALATVLVAGGVVLALFGPDVFSLGGWFSAAVFILFAFILRGATLREERGEAQGEAGAGSAE
ncbi:MAG: hypothetical protein GX649_19205 [Chloroflexi bacterium]|nr:hypothetical protein [Chloroflexota bacterium]